MPRHAASTESALWRPSWLTVCAVLLLAVVAFGIRSFWDQLQTTIYPVKFVRIEGAIRQLDINALSAALAPYWRVSYFAADLNMIAREVHKFSWVDSVDVRRVWPDTIQISLTEQTPVARWHDTSLLNRRGERFTPPDASKLTYLPVISGPQGQERYLLNIFRGLNERLKSHHLALIGLHVSERRAWTLRLDNGMDVLLGRIQPRERYDRFMQLLKRLDASQLRRLERLDMRYANGFSVKTKPGVALSPDAMNMDSWALGTIQ